MVNNNLVGGFNPTLPLWKMMEWKSNGMKFPMEKNENVPNHQPGYEWIYWDNVWEIPLARNQLMGYLPHVWLPEGTNLRQISRMIGEYFAKFADNSQIIRKAHKLGGNMRSSESSSWWNIFPDKHLHIFMLKISHLNNWRIMHKYLNCQIQYLACFYQQPTVLRDVTRWWCGISLAYLGHGSMWKTEAKFPGINCEISWGFP